MIIGLTGPGGSGKSSLINHLISRLRKQDKRVGVLAVDPSSPFSGGALLGDRIRFQKHSTDKGVYIRSMGSRGYLGGLARATTDVVRIMEAMGNDIIAHQAYIRDHQMIDEIHAKRFEQELSLIFKDEVEKLVFAGLKGTGKKRRYIDEIKTGRNDPYSVVHEVLKTFFPT